MRRPAQIFPGHSQARTGISIRTREDRKTLPSLVPDSPTTLYGRQGWSKVKISLGKLRRPQ
jgi:hypothetical protein